jgi:hypothetical protein
MKRYVLQNGTCYKTEQVTQQYMLKNAAVSKWYVKQNGTCYKMVRVAKRYVLQNGTSQNGTCY